MGLHKLLSQIKSQVELFLIHAPPDEVIAWFTDVTQPDFDTLRKSRPYIHLP